MLFVTAPASSLLIIHSIYFKIKFPTQLMDGIFIQGNSSIKIVTIILQRQYGRLDRVEVYGFDSIIQVPDLWVLVYLFVSLILKIMKDTMLILVRCHILFRVTAPLLSLIQRILQMPLFCGWHIINIIGTKKMVINSNIPQPSIAWLTIRFAICPPLVALKNSSNIIPCVSPINHKGLIERTAWLKVGHSSINSSHNYWCTRNHIRIHNSIICVWIVRFHNGIQGITSGTTITPHNWFICSSTYSMVLHLSL